MIKQCKACTHNLSDAAYTNEWSCMVFQAPEMTTKSNHPEYTGRDLCIGQIQNEELGNFIPQIFIDYKLII